MSSMSNYLENKLIDHLLRGSAYTAPSTLYMALCTAAPTDTSTGSNLSEISGGNYSRQSLSSNTTNWSATSGTDGTSTNSVEVKWAGVTWSGTVTHVAICDAASGGNVLFYSGLTTSQTVVSGDSISFGIGSLSIQIDN